MSEWSVWHPALKCAFAAPGWTRKIHVLSFFLEWLCWQSSAEYVVPACSPGAHCLFSSTWLERRGFPLSLGSCFGREKRYSAFKLRRKNLYPIPASLHPLTELTETRYRNSTERVIRFKGYGGWSWWRYEGDREGIASADWRLECPKADKKSQKHCSPTFLRSWTCLSLSRLGFFNYSFRKPYVIRDGKCNRQSRLFGKQGGLSLILYLLSALLKAGSSSQTKAIGERRAKEDLAQPLSARNILKTLAKRSTSLYARDLFYYSAWRKGRFFLNKGFQADPMLSTIEGIRRASLRYKEELPFHNLFKAGYERKLEMLLVEAKA